MTREPGFAPGWGALFVDNFVPDASPAVLLTLLAALTPAFLMKGSYNAAAANSPTHGAKPGVRVLGCVSFA